jgi:diacylglycerol kinase
LLNDELTGAAPTAVAAESIVATTVATNGARMKNKSFYVRMAFAITGIVEAAKRERSFRTQLAVAVGAIAVTTLLRPGLIWAAAVVLSIVLVLALELVNSAIEGLIDHIHPDIAPAIGLVKDVAAGAVLIASAGAVAVGVMMLLAVLVR